MSSRKQTSLDELFQLYPQLRVMAVTEPMSASQLPQGFLFDVSVATESLPATVSHYGEKY